MGNSIGTDGRKFLNEKLRKFTRKHYYYYYYYYYYCNQIK
jgi:hypothetical protein